MIPYKPTLIDEDEEQHDWENFQAGVEYGRSQPTLTAEELWKQYNGENDAPAS